MAPTLSDGPSDSASSARPARDAAGRPAPGAGPALWHHRHFDDPRGDATDGRDDSGARGARLLHPGGAAELVARPGRGGGRRRGPRPRSGVHQRALQQEGSRHAVRSGGSGERADPDLDRGHQPQHPPPDGHRRLRPHHAEPHRWALHPRPRPGHLDDAGRLRHPPHHHRPDGGLRRADASPLPRRGHHRPRRSCRLVPGAAPRRRARRAPPDGARGLRRQHPRARPGAASTRWCCTPSSPTRPPPTASTR